MSSVLGGPRLLLRQLGPGTRATAVVAVMVLMAAFLVSAGPRALARLGDSELSYSLARVAPIARALRAESQGQLVVPGRPASVDEVWGYIRTSLAQQRTFAVPALLRRGLGTTIIALRTSDVPIDNPTDPGPRKYELGTVSDPDFARRVRWTAGAAPSLWSYTPRIDAPITEESTAPPLPIGLSVSSARRLHASVGSQLRVVDGRSFRVTGLYRPVDDGDLFWTAFPRLRTPGERPVSSDAPPVVAADAIVSPLTPGLQGAMTDTTFTALFPVSSTAWRGEEAPRLLRDLRAISVAGFSVPSLGRYDVVPVTTSAVDAVDGSVGRIAALRTVAGIVGVPPIGILLLVLILGAGTLVAVRRAPIELAAARGATVRSVRLIAALEGAVVGIASAAVGALAGAAVTGFRADAAGTLLPILIGVAPAIIMAAQAAPRGIRHPRSDISLRRGGRWLRIAEAAVVVLAVASLVLLLQRDPETTDAADPLVTLAPLLLAATVGLAVVHLYPLPLRLAQLVLHRSRGVVGFLGAARGVRAPVVGLPAVLAIVVAVAVGVFPAVLLTTLDDAARSAPRATLGADIRATLSFGARIPSSASAVPGLARFATLSPQGPVGLGDNSVDLVTVTTSALHRIQPRVPSGMDRLRGGAIPVLASPDLHLRVGTRTRLAERSGVVVGDIPAGVDAGSFQRWIIVDQRFAPKVVRQVSEPTVLLADVRPGAPPRATGMRLGAALGSGTVVDDVESAYRELQRSPTVSGLAATTLSAAVVALVVAILCAVLSMLAASEARARTIGVLRILGLNRAQTGRLIAAELVPVALGAVVAGALLGIGLAALIRAVVDLRPFTGGSVAPPLVLDPGTILVALGGFLVVTGLAGLTVALFVAVRRPATPDRMEAG